VTIEPAATSYPPRPHGLAETVITNSSQTATRCWTRICPHIVAIWMIERGDHPVGFFSTYIICNTMRARHWGCLDASGPVPSISAPIVRHHAVVCQGDARAARFDNCWASPNGICDVTRNHSFIEFIFQVKLSPLYHEIGNALPFRPVVRAGDANKDRFDVTDGMAGSPKNGGTQMGRAAFPMVTRTDFTVDIGHS
jgi:hypothetical protein